ncbi:50S ribosomal protein L5 [bacterium]|nr:50S ribosomal protein L5 [bacterium]
MSEAASTNYIPRLKKQYDESIKDKYLKSGKYGNAMQIPKLEKIVLSCSLKEALQSQKTLEAMASDLSQIAGQKVILRKSKKAISNFKLRENVNIGCSVTLRRQRMWDFLDRFISIACPQIRDFKGFPEKSFDGRGNYSCGLKEHTVFPEVDYDKVDKIRGFNITIGTSAVNDSEALELLKDLGFPFKRQGV